MTELYIIRHGIAANPQDGEADEARPLTKEGDRKTTKIAKRLAQLGLDFDIIFTSPLVRARQTAEILQDVGLGNQIRECPALAPGGDIHAWISELAELTNCQRLVLVGHQPDLGNWAEILVWGEAKGNITLKKAGVIGISLPQTDSPIGRSSLFWLTSPRLLLG
jgi:phosphohistidine phosphatase